MRFRIDSVTGEVPPECTTHTVPNEAYGHPKCPKASKTYQFHTIEFATLEELREYQVVHLEVGIILGFYPRPHEYHGVMMDGSITIYDDYIE
jgi:hypothetical protein